MPDSKLTTTLSPSPHSPTATATCQNARHRRAILHPQPDARQTKHGRLPAPIGPATTLHPKRLGSGPPPATSHTPRREPNLECTEGALGRGGKLLPPEPARAATAPDGVLAPAAPNGGPNP